MFRKALPVLIILPLLSSCLGNKASREVTAEAVETTVETTENNIADTLQAEAHPEKSVSALLLEELGYVNIQELDPRIKVEMVYATPDNFVGEILYTDLTEAYLLPEAAEKLINALHRLQNERPEYSLLVYDAARPMSVQKKMWEVALKEGKQYYVSNPAKGGGLHNYGAAVDLTIIDQDGKPLPMGTEYDHLGPEANIDNEKELVRSGKITQQELDNRLLLRKIMTASGFRTVKSEWWHFNHCSREEAVKKYTLIDF